MSGQADEIKGSEALATFQFGEQEIRVGGTREVPLFCAGDVCAVLDLNPYDALRGHPEDEKGTETFRTFE